MITFHQIANYVSITLATNASRNTLPQVSKKICGHISNNVSLPVHKCVTNADIVLRFNFEANR